MDAAKPAGEVPQTVPGIAFPSDVFLLSEAWNRFYNLYRAYHLADGKPLRSGTPLTAFASSSMPTSPLREEGALTTEHPAWSAVVRHKRFIYIRRCRAAELLRWLSSLGA